MRRYLGWVIVVGVVILLSGNQVLIPDIMESRNLVTAREMVQDGNWMIPTMNGELRLEKPPLPTWIAAVTMMISGQNLWALRLMPALAGVLLLFWFFKLAYRTTGNKLFALCSSLILCTCYNFVLMAKTVTWDIYSHAFMLGSIYYLYGMLAERAGKWRNAVLSGLCLGLSVMSKGPVSLYALLLPFLLAAWIAYRDRLKWSWKHISVTVVIAIVIGCSWYAYIWIEQHSAGTSTLLKESGSWLNRNVRPWWYYSTFFTETGVWALLCVTSLFFPYWRKRGFSRKDYVFSLCWMVGILVLLSLLPEKKNRYLLPILIPASLTMGYVVEFWITRIRMMSVKDKRILSLNSYVVMLAELLLIVASVYVCVSTPVSLSLCLLLAAVFLIALVVHIWGRRRKKAACMLYSVVICFVGISALGMSSFAYYLGNPRHSFPRAVLDERYKGYPVYYPEGDEFRIELVYDIGRKVQPKPVGELAHPSAPCLLAVTENSKLSKDSLVVNAEKIGTYDANRQAYCSRPQFQYSIYLVSPSKCQ